MEFEQGSMDFGFLKKKVWILVVIDSYSCCPKKKRHIVESKRLKVRDLHLSSQPYLCVSACYVLYL